MRLHFENLSIALGLFLLSYLIISKASDTPEEIAEFQLQLQGYVSVIGLIVAGYGVVGTIRSALRKRTGHAFWLTHTGNSHLLVAFAGYSLLHWSGVLALVAYLITLMITSTKVIEEVPEA